MVCVPIDYSQRLEWICYCSAGDLQWTMMLLDRFPTFKTTNRKLSKKTQNHKVILEIFSGRFSAPPRHFITLGFFFSSPFNLVLNTSISLLLKTLECSLDNVSPKRDVYRPEPTRSRPENYRSTLLPVYLGWDRDGKLHILPIYYKCTWDYLLESRTLRNAIESNKHDFKHFELIFEFFAWRTRIFGLLPLIPDIRMF